MIRRAVVVGVDRYEHPGFSRLHFAVKDAIRMRQFLAGLPGHASFETIHVLRNCGDHELIRALRKCAAGLGEGDLFFFYFAGHGVQQRAGGQHLLLCRDAMPEVLYTSSTNGTIPTTMLDEFTSGAFDRVLVLDACRAPYVDDRLRARGVDVLTTMSGASSLREIGTGPMHRARGRTVTMWSCNDGERAAEDTEIRGGVFTHALLISLRDSIARTGAASLDLDLTLRVRSQMSRLTGVFLAQTPSFHCVGGPIDLSRVPESEDRPCGSREHERVPGKRVNLEASRLHERLSSAAPYALFGLAGVLLVLALLEFLGWSTLRMLWPTAGLEPP